MTGTATPGALHVEVTATEQGLAGAAEVRLVIVEDQVPLDEGGASRLLRYVVRADASAERVDLASPASFARDMPLPADVDATRVLVVAYVRVLEGAGTYEPGEVVQSATWSPRQSEPTHQVSKRVLVEHATATWCEPCHPSDDAIDLLAARSSQAVGSESYLHVPSPAGLAGLAMGAGAAVFLWRRRAA
jgi:hypothetical protein